MAKKELLRTLQPFIIKDLEKKIVILSGPRQCGKTTLAKAILPAHTEYLSYDSLEDRSILFKKNWDRAKSLLIFDELHKMPKWKTWLKGIYDKEGVSPQILVTGSARLDTFKKAGDSLAGRHFYYRLHPFDVKEIAKSKLKISSEDSLSRILEVGGYPEPFLNNDLREYHRWRKSHLDLILRQDLPDFQTIRDAATVEVLIELLRNKVGSGISVNALANDLGKDSKTVQKWLNILEDLFIIFRVLPYSKDISRSLKKEPKYYFYDTGLVEGNEQLKMSARIENLVACALLKECHQLADAQGIEFKLYYLKVKGGREIDFLLLPNEKSLKTHLIEVKWAESDASPNFKLFESHFKNISKIQLVRNLNRSFKTANGVGVIRAAEWLENMDLTRS